jgi:RimJ/RimL family protein N-acetyltransferase
MREDQRDRRIKILPYTTVDGVPTYKDSEIRRLYHRVVDEGFEDVLFHDNSILNAEEFLVVMKRPDTCLWTVKYDDVMVAMFWINRIEYTHAHFHFTFFKNAWGSPITDEVGRETMKFMFDLKETETSEEPMFSLLLGRLAASNTIAIEYAKRVGWKVLGEVPNLFLGRDGNPENGIVVYITKEDIK